MKIWIDIKMPHGPLFFKSFLDYFPNHEFFITSRNFSEINSLLDKYGIAYTSIGTKTEGHLLKRRIAFFKRVFDLIVKVPKYDLSLSHMSAWAIYASKIRGKKIIAFYDNDINQDADRFYKHVDYMFVPNAIPESFLISKGLKKSSIHRYEGFKEDIYLANYVPDPDFLTNLPFNNFVTIRAENFTTAYVDSRNKSLVPSLLSAFSDMNINVLFLPRNSSEASYSKNYDNVYIPPNALNGLDICYYSKAVLTGAGTMGREAARMGIPAITFFPGDLLSVDKAMIKKGILYHSRNVEEIINHLDLNSKSNLFNIKESKKVKKDIFESLEKIFEIMDGNN